MWRLVLGWCLAWLCGTATAAAAWLVPGQILVKPKPGLSEAEFAARLRVHHAFHRKTLARLNVHVLNVPAGQTEAVLAALRQDPGIEYAEPDALAQAAFVPNDPYVVSGQEWHLQRVQALSAWDYTTGNPGTVIAVIDSGINAAHPDLAGRVLPGYDFLNNDTDTSDSFGHGTAVAGVVLAAGDNDQGVAGVAYGCSVLPVKVVDDSGFATYSDIAEGIRYATDQGARVINISIAGSTASSTLQDAVDYAWSHNVLVVAAAGNNANNVPQYPAACEHVVAVSATEPDDSLAYFSSYGSYVTLSAPGDNIWTTQRDLSNPYGSWRGTSFASPIVAATAALVASANPALANADVVGVLEATADDIGAPGYDTAYGYGRVNVLRAVTTANPNLVPNVPTNSLVSDPAPTNAPPPPSSPLGTTAVLSVGTSGPGRVVPNLDGQVLPLGRGVRLRAVPEPGQVFAGWEGADSDSPILSFRVQSNLTLVAHFVPSPFPVVQGGYTGLVAGTNGVSPESSGYFRLTVTPMGRFSGRLLNGGRGYGFSGQFNLAGDAMVALKRHKASPLTLRLHVDLSQSTDQLGGLVTDGNWNSEVSADRNVFSARLNPAQQAGVRAFVLQASGQAPSTAASGKSRISRAGAASLCGKLSNRHPFALASALAGNGDCPFYVSFNRGSQVVLGWLNFPSGQQPGATGTLVWLDAGTNGVSASLLAASAP